MSTYFILWRHCTSLKKLLSKDYVDLLQPLETLYVNEYTTLETIFRLTSASGDTLCH